MRYLIMIFVAVFVMVLFCGCQIIDEPIAFTPMPVMSAPASSGTAVTADDAARTMERRFGGSEAKADNAVESALLMSEKYKELSLETEKLRQDNSTLRVENEDLARQISALEAELETARTELGEANEFLQQMHAELGKWKSDVLGYRDEMRRAQVAELEALKKILKILGAEFVEAPQESQVAKEG